MSIRLRRFALVLLATVPTGCGSTAELTRFDDFAQAGGAYVAALNGTPASGSTPAAVGLLARARALLVDSNSDKLLQTEADFPGTVTADSFTEQDEAMRANLVEFDRIRAQLELLDAYFAGVAAMATSKAPENFAGTLETAASSLDGLSEALGDSPLLKDAGGLVGSVGELIVRGLEVRVLKRELEARKQTIDKALSLQGSLLAALQAQIASEAQLARDQKYDEEVVQPFLDAQGKVSDVDAWKAKRRELLETSPELQQMQAAQSALTKLRAGWSKLLAGGFGPGDLQAVVTDLQPIVKGIETLKEKPAQDPPAGESTTTDGGTTDSGP